jgi:hypothetical protein
MTSTLPNTPDVRTDADNRLPRRSRAELAMLRTAHRAIPRADERSGGVGKHYLAAQAAWMADPSPENRERMIGAERQFKAAKSERERAVQRYLSVERHVIHRARAREARLESPPPRRIACRRVGQRRSHRTVAKPTVGGDSGDDEPAEPDGRRRRSSSGASL